MKIVFLVVGKTTDTHLDTLVADYDRRIKHYVSFENKVIPELKNTKAVSMDEQKKQEGQLILKALPDNATVVLLDEHGNEYRSTEFAAFLQKKMSASRDIYFVVGGPFGFSEEVYQRADHLLSISRMTFSHQMIRLLFTEQVYRALTILRGEKYHHE